MFISSPRNSLIGTRLWHRHTSDIRLTIVGNNIVDHSDVVGAPPVGAAPTTSSFSTQRLASIDFANTTARREEKHLSLGFSATYIRGLTVSPFDISFSQDDHNWYQGRRSDGKVGMIPRSFVKERGEDTEEVSIAPQLPARGEARKVDLREQDETPSAKLTNREKCALYENIKFLYPTDNHRVSLGVIRAPVQYPISRLSYDLVKSWSREIGCLNYRIALKFDRQLGKFQSHRTILHTNLAASRFQEILR